jgi:hypothetical protein
MQTSQTSQTFTIWTWIGAAYAALYALLGVAFLAGGRPSGLFMLLIGVLYGVGALLVRRRRPGASTVMLVGGILGFPLGGGMIVGSVLVKKARRRLESASDQPAPGLAQKQSVGQTASVG